MGKYPEKLKLLGNSFRTEMVKITIKTRTNEYKYVAGIIKKYFHSGEHRKV